MKDAQDVWQLLGNIPAGTIVAWVTVICAIICAIAAGTIRLYKLFSKYKEVKDENDDLKNTVKNHDQELISIREEMRTMKEEIVSELKEIRKAQDDSRETKIKELRHAIITSGEKAVADKKMTIREWKSLHDMTYEYTEKYKQNSYAKSLVEKVDRDVEVIGQLDEHGYDIE